MAFDLTAAAALLEEYRTVEREPAPKILVGDAILRTHVREADWTVDRLFSQDGQHMIVGASQGAKTWALFGLGVAIAHEDVAEFLGQRIVRHGRVVIESWEQGQAEDVRKLQKLITGHAIARCSDNLILLSDAPATLNDETYFTRRRRELREWGAVAYLVDSLSEAAGVELNDNTLYSAFWRSRVKPVLDDGIMVVFTHLRGHVKPGVGQNRDAASRGATQIRALSTGVIEMRQLTDTTFAVRHNKHRNGLALPFGTLTLDGAVDDGYVRLALAADIAGGEGKELLARRLLAQLAATAGGWIALAAIEAAVNDKSKPDAERVSKKVYKPVLDEMVREGAVEFRKRKNAHEWRWTRMVTPDPDDEAGGC